MITNHLILFAFTFPPRLFSFGEMKNEAEGGEALLVVVIEEKPKQQMDCVVSVTQILSL